MNSHELSLREKNIVFIGFMGVGKTTIGKRVAQKLYRSFIDADEEIEKAFGMSPTEVFKKNILNPGKNQKLIFYWPLVKR